ncbi:MAG: hypothetical protein D6795_13535 [Deltaproteobacteria bacterium]|nr:MAG: hypothetical protein D6795_13535 [Deltaproteobacteria bacterium]
MTSPPKRCFLLPDRQGGLLPLRSCGMPFPPLPKEGRGRKGEEAREKTGWRRNFQGAREA